MTIACLQDLSQARARWGDAAEGFLTLFGAKLILPGIADLRTLQLVSALAGEADVEYKSVTRPWNFLSSSPSTTTYLQRQPVLPVDKVAALEPGTVLAIWPGFPPVPLGLVPAWCEPWASLLARAGTVLR